MFNDLDYVILQQCIFNKFFVYGRGAIGDNESAPSKSLNGWDIYLNGKNDMPALDEDEPYDVVFKGSIYHDDLMGGMPPTSAYIDYIFVGTPSTYVLLVGVVAYDLYEEMARKNRREETEGDEPEEEPHPNREFTYDVAALVNKRDVPAENKSDTQAILRELLLGHLTVFLGVKYMDSRLEYVEFLDEEDTLKTLFQEYQSLVKAGKIEEPKK